MAKAIIFGASGQDGYYLGCLLEKEHVEFLRISRHDGNVKGTVGDFEFVKAQIVSYQPDYIFHFAAISTTRHTALFENHEAICTGTVNILEAVRLHCPNAKVFLSGSAVQFKNEGQPIDESTPFEPSSAYAVSRIQSIYSARYYRDYFGLKVYVGYFFNHDSTLRTEKHMNQMIISFVKSISHGAKGKLEIGDLYAKKEFNYAGDMMRAVWLLINQDKAYEAVLGSGKVYSILEWLEYCFNKIGKDWKDYVIKKEGFISEYQILQSNPVLIKSLGWQEEVEFSHLADMMFDGQL